MDGETHWQFIIFPSSFHSLCKCHLEDLTWNFCFKWRNVWSPRFRILWGRRWDKTRSAGFSTKDLTFTLKYLWPFVLEDDIMLICKLKQTTQHETTDLPPGRCWNVLHKCFVTLHPNGYNSHNNILDNVSLTSGSIWQRSDRNKKQTNLKKILFSKFPRLVKVQNWTEM